ncbi:MAG TPA: MlaD family protein [Verrucomicrobiae bacterium]|jgi:ABC-type transporter Mla subunit MlaD
MALQDLTPQLRTRLSRMERTVGWFVFLATALLLFGFGYYIYHVAENKGWFKIKASFHTFVESSAGLQAGSPVLMMGFPVGTITRVHAMPPGDPHNVKIEFEVVDPYFRYIRSGAVVKVNAGLLTQRQLEITRVATGYAICVTQPVLVFSNLDELHQKVMAQPDEWQLSQDVLDANTNILFHAYTFLNESNLAVIAALKPDSIYAYNNREHDRREIVAAWHPRTHRYENFTPDSDDAWLKTVEAPPVSDQLQAMVTQVQKALPGILALTNKLAAVLDNANTTLANAALATSNLNRTILSVQPLVTNFADISAQLRAPGGPVQWALGPNGNEQIQGALTNLNSLLAHTDTNLNTLVLSVGQTLDNVADITSNLNVQVQSDPNMLFGISKMVTDSDNLVQGLKRHWLLRSAFKKENAEMKKADEAAKKAAAEKAKN